MPLKRLELYNFKSYRGTQVRYLTFLPSLPPSQFLSCPTLD
jgi:chromosome segregation ATPase